MMIDRTFKRLGLPALIGAAQQAFLDGWSSAMWLAAGIALGAAATAAAIIPSRSAADAPALEAGDPEPALAT